MLAAPRLWCPSRFTGTLGPSYIYIWSDDVNEGKYDASDRRSKPNFEGVLPVVTFPCPPILWCQYYNNGCNGIVSKRTRFLKGSSKRTVFAESEEGELWFNIIVLQPTVQIQRKIREPAESPIVGCGGSECDRSQLEVDWTVSRRPSESVSTSSIITARLSESSSNSLPRHIRSPKNVRRNLHRCPGYLREGITLACDLSKSVIVPWSKRALFNVSESSACPIHYFFPPRSLFMIYRLKILAHVYSQTSSLTLQNPFANTVNLVRLLKKLLPLEVPDTYSIRSSLHPWIIASCRVRALLETPSLWEYMSGV